MNLPGRLRSHRNRAG